MNKLIFRAGCFVVVLGMTVAVLYPFLPSEQLMYVHHWMTGEPVQKFYLPGSEVSYFIAGPELISYLDSLWIIPLGILILGFVMAFVGYLLGRDKHDICRNARSNRGDDV